MNSIYNMTFDDLVDYLTKLNEKSYRARQIWQWIYKNKVTSPDDMSNLSKDLINKLNNDFGFNKLEIVKKQDSDLTSKYLFRLGDGNLIETVLMRHDYGLSVCVSSQVGCNMGCAFCESGRLKKVRNLETSEMVLQVLMIEADLNVRIDSVVIMGIGEPFDNYDNVINFIKIINDPYGIAIGARHITVSTSGIIPKIKEFMNLPWQVNLAISLHAPYDELRNKLMPINKAYPLNELITVLKDYIKKTNRRVTIEYVMLKGVNDSLDDASKIVSLLKNMNIYVNLIPYNETSHLEFKKSSKEVILKFYDYLKKHGVNVTIRKEFGGLIDAACGQLRAKEGE